jgi:hypothetical protein
VTFDGSCDAVVVVDEPVPLAFSEADARATRR